MEALTVTAAIENPEVVVVEMKISMTVAEWFYISELLSAADYSITAKDMGRSIRGVVEGVRKRHTLSNGA